MVRNVHATRQWIMVFTSIRFERRPQGQSPLVPREDETAALSSPPETWDVSSRQYLHRACTVVLRGRVRCPQADHLWFAPDLLRTRGRAT